MTHLIRRIARLLCMAGGCSLASLSLASPPEPTHAPAATTNVTPAQARLEAMKVEVALLGDPVSMRLPLDISVDGHGVVVKGEVPDDSARRRVLELARQSCYLPVQDALTIPSQTMVEPLTLKKAARDSLVRQLGGKADRFVVTVTRDGQVKLDGDVSSVEEKLQASRLLRAVPGCTRVVNCLSVRGVEQAGHLITVVSSDGQTVVCTPRLDGANADARPELALQRVQYSPEIYPTGPRMQPTVPSGLPQATIVNVAPAAPIVSQAPAPAAAGCGCNQGAVTTHERPSLFERLFAWRTSRTARRQQPATVPQEVYAPTYANQIPAGSPGLTAQPTKQGRTSRPRVIEATPVSSPRLVPTPVEPPPAPPALPEAPRQTGDATPWPPAYRSAPVTPAPAAAKYQSRPLGALTNQPRQAVVAPPAPAIVQTASMPEAKAPAALPTSVEALPAPTLKAEAKPEAAGPAPIRLTEKELTKRVSDACGKLAKEVRVEVGGDRGIIVHVFALPATEHLLVARLLHVPELGARNVQLHVHLAK